MSPASGSAAVRVSAGVLASVFRAVVAARARRLHFADKAATTAGVYANRFRLAKLLATPTTFGAVVAGDVPALAASLSPLGLPEAQLLALASSVHDLALAVAAKAGDADLALGTQIASLQASIEATQTTTADLGDQSRQLLERLDELLGYHHKTIPSFGDPAAWQYRAPELFGREDELEEVMSWTRSPKGQYLRIESAPWSGKTALLAEVVAASRYSTERDAGDPRIVAFFVRRATGRAGTTDFLSAVVRQLADELGLGRPLPEGEAALRYEFDRLWAEIETRSVSSPTVLVVDGLDEQDESGGPGRHTIASLLPRTLAPDTGVLVSVREGSKPRNIERDHPLYQPETNRLFLRPVPAAQSAQKIALQELGEVTRVGATEVQLFLGLLAAAGTLTRRDLESLSEISPLPLLTVAAESCSHILTGTGDLDCPWEFTHEELYADVKRKQLGRTHGEFVRMLSNWTVAIFRDQSSRTALPPFITNEAPRFLARNNRPLLRRFVEDGWVRTVSTQLMSPTAEVQAWFLYAQLDDADDDRSARVVSSIAHAAQAVGAYGSVSSLRIAALSNKWAAVRSTLAHFEPSERVHAVRALRNVQLPPTLVDTIVRLATERDDINFDDLALIAHLLAKGYISESRAITILRDCRAAPSSELLGDTYDFQLARMACGMGRFSPGDDLVQHLGWVPPERREVVALFFLGLDSGAIVDGIEADLVDVLAGCIRRWPERTGEDLEPLFLDIRSRHGLSFARDLLGQVWSTVARLPSEVTQIMLEIELAEIEHALHLRLSYARSARRVAERCRGIPSDVGRRKNQLVLRACFALGRVALDGALELADELGEDYLVPRAAGIVEAHRGARSAGTCPDMTAIEKIITEAMLDHPHFSGLAFGAKADLAACIPLLAELDFARAIDVFDSVDWSGDVFGMRNRALVGVFDAVTPPTRDQYEAIFTRSRDRRTSSLVRQLCAASELPNSRGEAVELALGCEDLGVRRVALLDLAESECRAGRPYSDILNAAMGVADPIDFASVEESTAQLAVAVAPFSTETATMLLSHLRRQGLLWSAQIAIAKTALAENPAGAIESVAGIRNVGERAGGLAELLGQFLDSGLDAPAYLSDLIDRTLSKGKRSDRVAALCEVALRGPNLGRLTRGRLIARAELVAGNEHDDESSRAWMHARLVRTLCELGQDARATEVATRELFNAPELQRHRHASAILRAAKLAARSDATAALALVDRIPPAADSVHFLAKLEVRAASLAASGVDWLSHIETLDDTKHRLHFALGLVDYYASLGTGEQLLEVLRQIPDRHSHAAACEVARNRLQLLERVDVLLMLLPVVDLRERGWLMISIAKLLTPEQRWPFLRDAVGSFPDGMSVELAAKLVELGGASGYNTISEWMSSRNAW